MDRIRVCCEIRNSEFGIQNSLANSKFRIIPNSKFPNCARHFIVSGQKDRRSRLFVGRRDRYHRRPMSKRVDRGRRETHNTRRAARSTRTVASVRSADPAPRDTGSVHHRLARLLDTPLLARVVPHLAPETLHQLIRYRGLDACGELVASATPEQLTSVFDLDLWPQHAAGRDERFDEDRFGEWLEAVGGRRGLCGRTDRRRHRREPGDCRTLPLRACLRPRNLRAVRVER